MNDVEIEQEIIEKGLVAPRLTPQLIEDTIVKEDYHNFDGTTVTICCLTLINGFNAVGKSACVSTENFDIELGKKIARDDAKNKIWQLEGYLLREKLYRSNTHTE